MEVEVRVAPGIVIVLGGRQVSFCVYQSVLGVGVYHNVLGAQLDIQNVDVPEVYGRIPWLGRRHVEIVLVKTGAIGGRVEWWYSHSSQCSVVVTMT